MQEHLRLLHNLNFFFKDLLFLYVVSAPDVGLKLATPSSRAARSTNPASPQPHMTSPFNLQWPRRSQTQRELETIRDGDVQGQTCPMNQEYLEEAGLSETQ